MSFKIIPDKIDTENKTIRFPVDLIEEINKISENNSITFSGFVIQACRYAIENIDLSIESKHKS